MAMAIIATNGWRSTLLMYQQHMYLQGKDMDREIFIIPPKIYCPDFNKCWILDKGVYGLKDAGRLWFLEI